MEKRAKICLSVIVKNESHVIERMLNSVYPILDYYCVVDTGSTDGTQDIIRDFFKEKGIPGKVIDHEWINFEDARNRAIKETQLIFSENGVEDGYGYWQDADEILQFNPNFSVELFKKNILDFDSSNVLIHYGNQTYYRKQFFRVDRGYRWYGPVHEVLVSDEITRAGIADGLTVIVKSDGNSWKSETTKEKYENHAKILKDYVENDPKMDPRWVFYLAQSYRDAGGEENLKSSLKWYQKRIEMTGGYWEEVYFSALMISNIKSLLKYPDLEVIESFLKCGKYNKYRIEHLIPIILHYQGKKEFDLAYIYGLRAMQLAGKLPEKSTLFVDKDVYRWKVYDLHSISSWYSGRKDESKIVYRKLMKAIKKGFVPQNQSERINGNKKHFLGI